MSDEDELELLEAALAAQEALRGSVPDQIVDATVSALRVQIDRARKRQQPKRRRLATVLFADVSGSTELGERIDAEELSDRFDVLWETLDRIIRSHGGVVDKHIGDAVMALWGVEESSEHDPERAIRAGLAMLEALDGLRARDVLPGTAMRIGINTGPVVFGAIAGTAEETAMGDTVNVAARLESAAPLGSVLIGQDTYQHVRGVFAVGLREPLSVKGKSEPLRTYLVEAVRPRAFRLHARTIAGVETPMVAREREFAQLQLALERVLGTAQPEVVSIVGAAGMGKSRLLFEFEDWLRARDGEVRRFAGRGDPEQQGIAYGVWRDVLFDRFEITEDEPAAIARAKLEVGVRSIADADLTDEVALIGHLIGLEAGSTPTIDVDDGAAAVAKLLGDVAAHTPVVLLLEDVHWADAASAALLRDVIEQLDDGRVLIVVASRPDDDGDGPLVGVSTTIELDPLGQDAIETLLVELLERAPEVPPVLVDRVTAAAGGNPFYVEELVRMFLDEGAIAVDDDGWHFDIERLEHIRVPPTLRGVLQARLDQLDPGEFTLLQRAAIVGPRFWPTALPETSTSAPSDFDLDPTLDALVRKGLLQRVPTSDFAGEDEHGFAHAVLHEVVYESVLIGERAGMHGQVGDWMASRAESAAATIAVHYRAAERLDDAARWFATAARRARERSAATEGIDAARAALATNRLDDRQQADCLDHLIDCLSIAARYDEALELTFELEAVGSRLGDRAVVVLGSNHRAHLLLRLGRSREALTTAQAALAAAGDLPNDAPTVIDALTELGWVLVRLGRSEEAADHADDALVRISGSTDIALRRRVISLAGVASMGAGRFSEAERHLATFLDLVRLHGDRRSEAGGLINLSEVARLRGDLERAIALGREALDLIRKIRDLDQEALVLSNLGGALVASGDAPSAMPLLESAIEAFDRSGGSEHTSETHRFLAECHLALGDVGAARTALATAFRLAASDESPEHLASAWVVAGAVVGASGEPWAHELTHLDAEACLRRAERLFAEADLRRDRALALRELAAVLDSPERQTLLDEANAVLLELDLPMLVARASVES